MRDREGCMVGQVVPAILSTLAILVWLAVPAMPAGAADYFLHTPAADTLDQTSPTGTTAKFKDSPAVNRAHEALSLQMLLAEGLLPLEVLLPSQWPELLIR
jgi:hypothetical protein